MFIRFFMRKNVFGRQLKRDKNERKALFKGLMSSLVLYGRIKTTEAKAKAIKGTVEKLVTKTRKSSKEFAHRFLMPYLSNIAVKKFVVEITPRFTGRLGGYTRIIKIGSRLKDNAKMVVMEWVEGEKVKTTRFAARRATQNAKAVKKKVLKKKKEEKK